MYRSRYSLSRYRNKKHIFIHSDSRENEQIRIVQHNNIILHKYIVTLLYTLSLYYFLIYKCNNTIYVIFLIFLSIVFIKANGHTIYYDSYTHDIRNNRYDNVNPKYLYNLHYYCPSCSIKIDLFCLLFTVY